MRMLLRAYPLPQEAGDRGAKRNAPLLREAPSVQKNVIIDCKRGPHDKLPEGRIASKHHFNINAFMA